MKKTIEERVDRVEKIFWVVGVIAVIFGISGGWGYSLLQSAETKLHDLTEKVGNVKSEIHETTQKAIVTLTEEEDKAIERLNKKAEKQLSFVPTGAVMAFNLKSCPEGWKEAGFAKGRFIIGVGETPDLTPRRLLEEGGEEQHKLTIAEMPKHKHIWNNVKNDRPDDYGFGGSEKNIYMSSRSFIDDISQEQGGGQPHNNLPPFVALLFCEKQ
jgi:hypothetical protein